ncbi:hypothetical protein Zm00014a_016976 [Zea mays]|uniref:Uncharacterized protein n=1 Tax=Zea mays TaxID=4577 RepID=A0A3L6G8D0_MAIZE|nr:hypothetical protein Zm00014a_016976 [Zea mays]
MLQSTVQN